MDAETTAGIDGPGRRPGDVLAGAGGARRFAAALIVLAAVWAAAAVAAVANGPVRIPPGHVVSSLASRAGLDIGTHSERERLVIERLRLPRVVLATLAGASLAAAGATMQALFRNPLADPGLLGVSSGAAMGAVAAIAAGLGALSMWWVCGAAFGGALGAVGLVYLLGAPGGRPAPSSLLLAGVAVSAFLGSVTSVIIALVPPDEALRGILFWLAGGFGGASWSYVRVVTLPIAAGLVVLAAAGRPLNLLAVSDEVAATTGVRVGRTRAALLAAATLVTAVSVSVSGTIGFVGLVVPHLLRLVIGPDYRGLLPASMLAGAAVLVGADTAARTVVRPAELQVGMVTALVGAPVFAAILLRQRSRLSVQV
ncbi:MAG: hemin ABC transporter permease [Tepidiforma sp.]|nr:iron ABC transporter permease [Tepidiforma sp.]GIW17817.1 MAG: hemin ABC transporter permease [Tepidiforma sp.]